MKPKTKYAHTRAVRQVFWPRIGAVFLFGLILAIMAEGIESLTRDDLIYLAVFGAIVLAWWFLFSEGNPRTSLGKQTTAAQLHRWMLLPHGPCLTVWAVALQMASMGLAD